METSIHNKLTKIIAKSIIQDLKEQNKNAPKSERYFAEMTQLIFYQFIHKNKFIDNENLKNLCEALSKVMEFVFFRNCENNHFIKKQRDSIALVLIYTAQNLSIESLERIGDFSSLRNTEAELALRYAQFALKIVNDSFLKSQIKETYENQILHNVNVCAIADNFKEKFKEDSEISSQKLYKQMIDSENSFRKTNSVKILSWILVVIIGIILGFYRIISS